MTQLREELNQLFSLLNRTEETDSGRKLTPNKIYNEIPSQLDSLNDCIRELEDKRLGDERLKASLRKFFAYLDAKDSVYISSCRVLDSQEISSILQNLKRFL